MTSNILAPITLQFFARNAPSVGPTSSADQNAMMTEIGYDLANLATAVNVSLVNLVSLLPDGTVDSNVDAFDSGLDGRTFYLDASASIGYDVANYNSTAGRPYTVYEKINTIINSINSLQIQVTSGFSVLTVPAADVTFADAPSIYNTSTNVEDALIEVMNKVDLITSGTNLSNIVPYTGAASGVNLGAHSLTASGLSSTGAVNFGTKTLQVGNTTISGTLTVSGITNTSSITNTGNITTSAGCFIPSGVSTFTASGSTCTVNFGGGNAQYLNVTTSGACLVTLSGLSSGGSYLLEVNNTTSGVLTFSGVSTSVKWPNGVKPTVTVSGIDMLSFTMISTTIFGSYTQALR